MQEQDDSGTSCMELASHVTQPKEPRFGESLTAAKVAGIKPPRERNEVFRHKLLLFICFFPPLLVFVISELCDVHFMRRRFYFLDVPEKDKVSTLQPLTLHDIPAYSFSYSRI